MTTIKCGSCQRANKVGRRYCGDCGTNLAPVCRDCGFANDDDDRHCGGCGVRMMAVEPIPRCQVSSPGPATKPAAMPGGLDLVELFRAPERTSELPKIGIAQRDLDQLFGGAS